MVICIILSHQVESCESVVGCWAAAAVAAKPPKVYTFYHSKPNAVEWRSLFTQKYLENSYEIYQPYRISAKFYFSVVANQ